MNIIRNEGGNKVYKIECFQGGHGYEPTWQACDSTTDYDDALIKYNEFLKVTGCVPLRLVSQTVSIDILEERL